MASAVIESNIVFLLFYFEIRLASPQEKYIHLACTKYMFRKIHLPTKLTEILNPDVL